MKIPLQNVFHCFNEHFSFDLCECCVTILQEKICETALDFMRNEPCITNDDAVKPLLKSKSCAKAK
jgi:hypothetical protein